jgi:putative ABC transport system permease protein
MIAYDPDSDFIVKSWLEDMNIGNLGDNDVLVGHSIEGEIGDKLTFFNKEFTIAGKLNDTDTSYDESVFLNFDAAKELLQDKVLSQLVDIKDSNTVISSLMIRLTDSLMICLRSDSVSFTIFFFLDSFVGRFIKFLT